MQARDADAEILQPLTRKHCPAFPVRGGSEASQPRNLNLSDPLSERSLRLSALGRPPWLWAGLQLLAAGTGLSAD